MLKNTGMALLLMAGGLSAQGVFKSTLPGQYLSSVSADVFALAKQEEETIPAAQPTANAGISLHSGVAANKVRFGVISDTHIGHTSTEASAYPLTKRLDKVMRWYKAQGVDIVSIVGDLVDEKGSSFTQFGNALALYVNVPGKHDNPGSPRLVAAMGNHDKNYVGEFENATGLKNTAHYVINGYDFITVSPGAAPTDLTAETAAFNTGGSNKGDYPTTVRDWLRARLNKAKAERPGRPIFVFIHYPVRNTFYVSNEWYTDAFGSNSSNWFFRDDPEVVVFSGHIHSPNNDPRSIWQGGFTSVNTASIFYIEMERTYLGKSADGLTSSTYPKVAGDAFGQGLIVSVSGSVVTIENYDFDMSAGHTENVYRIPQTWTFDVSNPATFPYTDARSNQRQSPVFDPAHTGAAIPGRITFDGVGETSVNITFSQATMPTVNPVGEVVHSYEFEFRNITTGAIAYTAQQWSDFMLTERLRQPTYTQLLGGLQPGVEYELRIYAFGSFQQKSTQYLTATFKTAGTPVTKNHSASQ